MRGLMISEDLGELRELYRKTFAFVLAKARGLMSNEADALDVAQEVFLRAQESWPKLSRHPSRLAWLLTTTTRLSIDRLRHARMARRSHASLSRDSPTSPAASLEASMIVESLLDEESELTQLIIVHVLIDGWTHDETAEMLDISRKTVHRHLERFKQKCTVLFAREAEVNHV